MLDRLVFWTHRVMRQRWDQARFDYLVALPESADLGDAIDNTMKLIEDEYENLKGVLPKNFSIFSKDLLRELLRIFNKEVLQKPKAICLARFTNTFSTNSLKQVKKKLSKLNCMCPNVF